MCNTTIKYLRRYQKYLIIRISNILCYLIECNKIANKEKQIN